jgi:hypothetical protein
LDADAVWPEPASIPFSVKPRAMASLVACGLVEAMPNKMYQIHGLTHERTLRSQSGRTAAAVRWHSDRIQTPDADPMPRRAETSRDEQSSTRRIADASNNADGRSDLEAFLMVRRRAPTARQRQILDDVLDRHDVTGSDWAAQIILNHPDDPIGAVIAADKAWRDERIAEAKKDEAKPKPPSKRRGGGLTGINAELAALLRDQYGEPAP